MSKQPASNPNYPEQPPPQGQGYAPPQQGHAVAPPPQGYAAAPPPQGHAAAPPPGYGAPPAYAPPPQGYPPQPQGYAPPPQGYAPPPQGYAPPPQGYAPPPQGYAPPPQGYAPPPQGYAPPPQGYAPPPQGYAPPPQGYAPPPQGYAPPPQGYAPPPPDYGKTPPAKHVTHHVHTTTTVKKQPSSMSTTLGGLFKSAEKLASGAVSTVQREIDIHASSPLLSQFGSDNILQFNSCASNRYLRALPNGGVDAVGVHTAVDTQFIVVNHGNNIVSLRNLATQNKFLTIVGDRLLCTGVGNHKCKFRLHETSKGFMTFESLAEPGCHIAVLPTGEIKDPKLAKSKDESAQFSVTLLYTRLMQAPQTTHTVYHTSTVVKK